eukprot:Skav231408  [mRNA]  locus=scaffold4039:55277:69561:- [translate_table: standard]
MTKVWALLAVCLGTVALSQDHQPLPPKALPVEALSEQRFLWTRVRDLPQKPFKLPAVFIFNGHLRAAGIGIWDFFSAITLWKMAPWWCSWVGYLLAWILWLVVPLGLLAGFYFGCAFVLHCGGKWCEVSPFPFECASLLLLVLLGILFAVITLCVPDQWCTDAGRDLVDGRCVLRTCTCNNGVPTHGAFCPESGAESCDSCNRGYSLPLACNLFPKKAIIARLGGFCHPICECDNGEASTGPACPGAKRQHCATCDSSFQLFDHACLTPTCVQAFQGVHPYGGTGAHTQTAAPCADANSGNGTIPCTVPQTCIDALRPENPLKDADAYTKGAAPLELGIPPVVLGSTSGILVAVPIIYSLAMRKPFMLTVEIALSSADFASDILNTFGNDYFGYSTFATMLTITLAAGICTVVSQFCSGLCFLFIATYQRVAWSTWKALAENGCHQVFEEHGDSPEKFGLNMAVTFIFGILTPLLIVIVAPITATLHLMTVFLLGVVLHSLRLLFAKEILVMYESCIGKATNSPGSEKEGVALKEGITEKEGLTKSSGSEKLPTLLGAVDQSAGGAPRHETTQHVDPRKYHMMVFVELLVEALPSVGATMWNYKLMRDSCLAPKALRLVICFMVEKLSWAATMSLVFSGYMVLRVGYKYTYHLVFLGRSFEDIPLPYKEAVEDGGRVVSLECEIQLEEDEMVLDDEPLCILRTVQRTGAKYALWSHQKLAAAAGVPAEVIDKLSDGRDAKECQPLLDEQEMAALTLCDELLAAGMNVSEATYAGALGALGERQTFEAADLWLCDQKSVGSDQCGRTSDLTTPFTDATASAVCGCMCSMNLVPESPKEARVYSKQQICCPDLLVPRGSQSVLGVPYLANDDNSVVFVDVVDPTLGVLRSREARAGRSEPLIVLRNLRPEARGSLLRSPKRGMIFRGLAMDALIVTDSQNRTLAKTQSAGTVLKFEAPERKFYSILGGL